MKRQIFKINTIGFLIVNLLICYNLAISQVVVIKDKGIVKHNRGGLSFSNGTSFSINSSQCVFNGTIEFAGSKDQSISGTQNARFANLLLNNSSVLTLLRDVEVRNRLSLISGVLYVLDNNLLIKGNAVIDGNFSETAMIAVNANGRLLKEVPGVGSYYLPVGDLTDLADFSPVTLNIKSGKFSRAIVSINLRNLKHPKNTSPTNYLKRYWSIRQTGIIGLNCDVTLAYPFNDIVGTEANISGALWNIDKWTYLNQSFGNKLTGNVKLFSDITGIQKIATIASQLKTADVNIIVSEAGISLQPNDYIKLQKIDIYNKAGQLVYSRNLESSENPDLSLDLSSDIYLVKIETNQEVFTKKIFLP